MIFLAGLAAVQAACVTPVAPIPPDEAARAIEHGMPPIDRNRLKRNPGLLVEISRFLVACATLEMPEGAAAARDTLLADPERLAGRLADVLEDAVPMEAVAEYVFVAAGVQVHLAGLAAQLPAAGLQSVGDGVCPCCGGPPVGSVVVERGGAHGARFCVCAGCATEWNVVRVKCSLCGSTEGIAYQELEGSSDGIKAETCDACGLYAKIFAQNEHSGLDPVADDVASLALDLKLAESAWKRGAVNAFLAGY